MWSMTSGVSEAALPDKRGEGDALSVTLLKGVVFWRLRRWRLKLALCCGVLYWNSWASSVSMRVVCVCAWVCVLLSREASIEQSHAGN